MNLPALAIFDMDGLLFDTERIFMNQKGIIMKEYGYDQTEEDYIRTIGTAGDLLMKVLFDLYGPDYPADEITQRTRKAQVEYMRTHKDFVKPGIRKLLAWLAEQGVPCCIATSSKRPYAEEFLQISELAHYFSFIIAGDDITRSKPDPQIFLMACERGGVTPADALVFEDSENGVLSASAAGIPVICIPDMVQPKPEIAKKASHIITEASDAISIMCQCPN